MEYINTVTAVSQVTLLQSYPALQALEESIHAFTAAQDALQSAQGTKNRAAQAVLTALCGTAAAIKTAATPDEREAYALAGAQAFAALSEEAQAGLLNSRMYFQGDYIALKQFIKPAQQGQRLHVSIEASAQMFAHWAQHAENGCIVIKPQGGTRLPNKQAFAVCLQAGSQYEQAEKAAKPLTLKLSQALTALESAIAKSYGSDTAAPSIAACAAIRRIAKDAAQAAAALDEQHGRLEETAAAQKVQDFLKSLAA